MNAVASRNMKFLGHTDQGGRGDGVQVMVNRGHAYIGHGFSNGITVIDVRDPRAPSRSTSSPARRTRARIICRRMATCSWRSTARASGRCR